MSWLDTNSGFFRAAILSLFIASLAGPWMYDVIHVPAQYQCEKPFVRLGGDFCGIPMSGMQFFEWFTGVFLNLIVALVTGTFTGRGRELFVMGLSILPLIPFFTTILLFWKKEAPRLRTINLIAWILALILTLTLFLIQIRDHPFHLWGLWLYILAAISAVTFELLMRKNNSVSVDGSMPTLHQGT
jgi:hypothetical protein